LEVRVQKILTGVGTNAKKGLLAKLKEGLNTRQGTTSHQINNANSIKFVFRSNLYISTLSRVK
jgi:hypothetical protein